MLRSWKQPVLKPDPFLESGPGRTVKILNSRAVQSRLCSDSLAYLTRTLGLWTLLNHRTLASTPTLDLVK